MEHILSRSLGSLARHYGQARMTGGAAQLASIVVVQVVVVPLRLIGRRQGTHDACPMRALPGITIKTGLQLLYKVI